MRIVVGLGNPGNEYSATRHNVGWEVLDEFAARAGWIGKGDEFNRAARTKFEGMTLDGIIGGTEKVLLLKPTTYMNLSGRSVQAAMAFYQVTAPDIMVVLDDLALPCGRLRIRKGGSSGGHNGLKNIEQALGTDQFPRLRLGIDAPPSRVPGRDYVLARFTTVQRELMGPTVQRAAEAIGTWIEKGIESAMNQFNAEAEKKE